MGRKSLKKNIVTVIFETGCFDKIQLSSSAVWAWQNKTDLWSFAADFIEDDDSRIYVVS